MLHAEHPDLGKCLKLLGADVRLSEVLGWQRVLNLVGLVVEDALLLGHLPVPTTRLLPAVNNAAVRY